MGKQMKSAVLWGLGLVILAAACDKKSIDNNLTEGNYESEEFLLAKQDADSTVIEMNADDQEVGDWLVWNPGLLASPNVDSVIYDSTGGWHLRSHTFQDEYIEIAVVDSFRLTDLNHEYQFRRDSTTNEFERRLTKSFTLDIRPESLGTYWVKQRSRNTHWVGLADSVTTLNGAFRRYWNGQSEYRSFEREVTGEFTDTQVYTADLLDGRPIYPFAGSFFGQLTMDVERPNRQVHIEGTLEVTFYPDHYHARLVRGENWWEWDHYYNP